MKHVIIGDLHGRDVWQQVNFSKYEKAVFLGDYVDSFKRSDRVILDNRRRSYCCGAPMNFHTFIIRNTVVLVSGTPCSPN